MRLRLAVFLVAVTALAQTQSVITLVERAALAFDYDTADRVLEMYRRSAGITPEYIEAFSWVGRARLSQRNFEAAETNAGKVRDLALKQITSRGLDAEPHLPIALGASIEVQAQALAGDGKRDQAVTFLRTELKRWEATSINARIEKNLNLLTLEGKLAPALDVSQSLDGRKLQPLSEHHGHPVLLFLWAHWCSDCKNEIPIIAKLQATYGRRGLEVIAPTQHYGYVAGGIDAPPAQETRYIHDVFAHYYASLGQVDVPLSEENFRRYGVSTTPTLVLIDSAGIVRMYNPGNLTYEALEARVRKLVR